MKRIFFDLILKFCSLYESTLTAPARALILAMLSIRAGFIFEISTMKFHNSGLIDLNSPERSTF